MATTNSPAIAALREVMAGHGGLAPAAVVVEMARPEDSPLHRYFCWDDGEAADRYRLFQAGMLVRRMRVHVVQVIEPPRRVDVEVVQVDRKPRTIRFAQSLRGERIDGGGYRLTEEIAADPELSADMVATLRSELVAWIGRAQDYCDAALAAGREATALQSVVSATADIVNEAWPEAAIANGREGDGGGDRPTAAAD